jgi:hypothetical protein
METSKMGDRIMTTMPPINEHLLRDMKLMRTFMIFEENNGKAILLLAFFG